MGFVSGYREKFEHRSMVSNPDDWLTQLFGGSDTIAGVRVSEEKAQNFSAFYLGVKLIAETLGQVPLKLYRRLPDGTREEARDHPLWNLLHKAPNGYQSAVAFKETIARDRILRGRFAARVGTDGNGRHSSLIRMHPDGHQPFWKDARIWHRYQPAPHDPASPNGAPLTLAPDEAIHVPLHADDPVGSKSLLHYARESLGLSLGTERYGAQFFGNDASPRGLLIHPKTLSAEAKKNIKESWSKSNAAAAGQAQGVAVLEEEMKYEQVGLSAGDAQFLETRQFQIAEVARWLNLPPHLLKDLLRATFSNIEHQTIEFVQYTMLPWFCIIAAEFGRQLLTTTSEQDLYFEFEVNSLVMGDIKARFEAYHQAIGDGWLSPNEVRKMENKNPIDGGDIHLQPVNMIPLGSNDPADLPTPPDPAPTPPTDQRPGGRARAFQRLFLDAQTRVLTREAGALRKIAKRCQDGQVSDLLQEIDKFYTEHRSHVEKVLAPAVWGLAETYPENRGLKPEEQGAVSEFLRETGRRACARWGGQVKAACRAQPTCREASRALDTLLDKWLEERAAREAADLTALHLEKLT